MDRFKPDHSALGVDLRGTWHHPGKDAVNITQPEQFVRYGIRVSRSAILATPGWGNEALKSYDDAVEAADSRQEAFRLEEQPYIRKLLDSQRITREAEEALRPSDWGPLPTFGSLVDDGQPD